MGRIKKRKVKHPSHNYKGQPYVKKENLYLNKVCLFKFIFEQNLYLNKESLLHTIKSCQKWKKAENKINAEEERCTKPNHTELLFFKDTQSSTFSLLVFSVK
uniref:Uncharacterized protein n=1 Tax=Micrurus surinamensis TaxID=129470 RepID=A0A2D4PJV8_MICSU